MTIMHVLQPELVFDVSEYSKAPRVKVSPERFFQFQQAFYKANKRGEQHQRFGQAFYNEFDTSGVPFPELFYMTNEGEAKALIHHHYIEV